MELVKCWLEEEGYEKFNKAKVLSEETSKTDPETDPYRSKYEAREILSTLKNKVEELANISSYISDASSKTNDHVSTVPEQREPNDDIAVPNDDLALSKDDIAVSTDAIAVSTNDIALTVNETCVPEVIKDILTPSMLLVIIDYELAKNFFDCEEVSTGQEYLEKCLEFIEQTSKDTSAPPLFTCLHISVNNQLSLIWSNRGDYAKARSYLVVSEDIYKDAKTAGVEEPLNYNEIWEADPKSSEDVVGRGTFFERIHTLTLYYLAQVCMKLDDANTAAKYCHVTLVRQMELKQYEAMEWSINCATLSQYYITQNQFNLARYCLCCSEFVNKEAVEEFERSDSLTDKDEKERAEEKMFKSRADVQRCWAKYCLNLLEMSHNDKLAAMEKQRDSAHAQGEQKCLGDGNVDNTYRELKFPNIDVAEEENQVPDSFASDFTSAKVLFNTGLRFLETAKEFYRLDGFVTNYVEIVQDTSQFYKYLSFFDDDFENRSKMYKRRANMLNEILVELNPKHFLQICRQLTFEIAEIYTELVTLKKAIIEEDSSKFSVAAVKKINYVILQGIKYYQGFIDTYKKEGELPETFEEDDVRGVLMCFFCMARLNSKYCTVDKQTKSKYLTQEKFCYQYIVDYCDRNEKDMPNVFEEEEKVSREMLALFDGKMHNTLNQMRDS